MRPGLQPPRRKTEQSQCTEFPAACDRRLRSTHAASKAAVAPPLGRHFLEGRLWWPSLFQRREVMYDLVQLPRVQLHIGHQVSLLNRLRILYPGTQILRRVRNDAGT